MVKKSKLITLIGSITLFAWFMLLPIYLISDESLYLAIFLLSGIFIAPILWGLITEIVGEDRISTACETTTQAIFWLCVGAIFLSGVCVLIFQIYEYLKKGEWVIFSVIDGLLFIDSSWAKEPDDWLGVWKILNSIPLSLALIIIVFIAISSRKAN